MTHIRNRWPGYRYRGIRFIACDFGGADFDAWVRVEVDRFLKRLAVPQEYFSTQATK